MNMDATGDGGSTVLSKLAVFAAEDTVLVASRETWRRKRVEGKRRKMRKKGRKRN